MKPISAIILLLGAMNNLFAQSCLPEDYISVVKTNRITTSYGLVNFLGPDSSSMYYCPELFSEENGSGFILDYVDEGGSGMDAYPNATCGGIKKGGVWYPGDKAKVGMPVQISDISNEMHFVWHTSQENAWDSNDGWMSSINFIFDNYGTENSEPVSADRDFDLVVKLHSNNFADKLTDQPTPAGVRIWYFAREANGDLKPYELTVDGVTYTYAVRYKFFMGAGDKDNKAHVKLIPYGPAGAPYKIKVNIKEVINVAKNYIQYANMPQAQRDLANTNIAPDHSWLKSINAGYEVYSGTSILKTDKFKVNTTDEVTVVPGDVKVRGIELDLDSLDLVEGEDSVLTFGLNPEDATDTLVSWTSSDESVATVDSAGLVTAKAEGTAYITVITNDGGHEDTCLVNVMRIVGNPSINATSGISIYPNPAGNNTYIRIASDRKIERIDIYNISGTLLQTTSHVDSQVNIRNLQQGIYIIRIHESNGNIEQQKLLIGE